MPRTNEELKLELGEAQIAVGRLVEHAQQLAEVIRISSTETLAQVRQLNEAYKQHADFMTIIDNGMKDYAGREAEADTGT